MNRDLHRTTSGEVIDLAPPTPPPPSRLVYGEDLRAGQAIEIDRRPTSVGQLIAQQVTHHDCSTHRQWATILEIRQAGGAYAAVLVDDAGQQQPLYFAALQLLTIRADQ